MQQIQQKNTTRVEINSRVLVRFQSGETMLCTIVQSDRTDPASGTISCDSPLGKALLGKSKGERASYAVGDHILQVDILEIYPGAAETEKA